MVKFVLCLLCSRHEGLDSQIRDWNAILVGKESEPRDLPMVALLICILDPVFFMPIPNMWVISSD